MKGENCYLPDFLILNILFNQKIKHNLVEMLGFKKFSQTFIEAFVRNAKK